MGAGSVTSNVKSDKTLVVIKDENERIETNLKKVGAMLEIMLRSDAIVFFVQVV